VQSGDAALDFLAALIEEYADEWGNKPMFHFRWFYDVNAKSAGLRIAQETVPPGSPPEAAVQMGAALEARMVPRLSFVGSGRDVAGNPALAANAELIERSFRRLVGIVEGMLATRSYLFGGHPTMADFGIYAQLKELLSDPTPGEYLRAQAPRTCAWIARMEDPKGGGDLLPLAALSGDLSTLLRDEIGGCFLPWSDANAKALAAGKTSFTVHIDGIDFTQDVQKYHAKSLAEIRRKYALVKDNAVLNALLAETGCLPWLES
jgi:hypothetical protein